MERLLDEGWSMRALVRGASKLEASARQRVEVVDDELNEVGIPVRDHRLLVGVLGIFAGQVVCRVGRS